MNKKRKKKESKDKHVSETHLSSVRNDDIACVGFWVRFLCVRLSVFVWVGVCVCMCVSVNVRPCCCLSVCESLSHRSECLSLCFRLSLCLCVTLLVCMSLYQPYCASINDGVIYSHFQLTTTIVFTWAGIIEHLFSVTRARSKHGPDADVQAT